jgi:hypothetical protein
MNELEISYDAQGQEKVSNSIDFGVVEAGQKTSKEIYVKNIIEWKVSARLRLTGENIDLIDKELELLPGQIQSIKFELTPKLTEVKPITGSVEIFIKYVVS